MNLKSILSDVGHGFEKFFTGAVQVAQVAEPFVDIAFPGIAPLYNTTVNAVIHAENAAIAAGSQNGTGAQKLSAVVAEINNDFLSYAKSNGINVSGDTITKYVNAVVATLNAIPSANVPVAIATTSVPSTAPLVSNVAPATGASVTK